MYLWTTRLKNQVKLYFTLMWMISGVTKGQRIFRRPEYVVSECYGDIFNFDCGPGNKIRINKDFFGYNRGGTCRFKQPDCVVSNPKSHSLIHRFCTGRRVCTYYLVERKGCNGFFSNYQQVEYQCIPDKTITNICDKISYITGATYISSPNFPDSYPPNQNCKCMISSPNPRVRVQLEIVYLAIKYTQPCQDWLRIGRRKTCGTTVDLFHGRRIPIEFHSDHIDSHNGFWLHLRASKPGEKIIVRCNNATGRFNTVRKNSTSFTTSSPTEKPETTLVPTLVSLSNTTTTSFNVSPTSVITTNTIVNKEVTSSEKNDPETTSKSNVDLLETTMKTHFNKNGNDKIVNENEFYSSSSTTSSTSSTKYIETNMHGKETVTTSKISPKNTGDVKEQENEQDWNENKKDDTINKIDSKNKTDTENKSGTERVNHVSTDKNIEDEINWVAAKETKKQAITSDNITPEIMTFDVRTPDDAFHVELGKTQSTMTTSERWLHPETNFGHVTTLEYPDNILPTENDLNQIEDHNPLFPWPHLPTGTVPIHIPAHQPVLPRPNVLSTDGSSEINNANSPHNTPSSGTNIESDYDFDYKNPSYDDFDIYDRDRWDIEDNSKKPQTTPSVAPTAIVEDDSSDKGNVITMSLVILCAFIGTGIISVILVLTVLYCRRKHRERRKLHRSTEKIQPRPVPTISGPFAVPGGQIEMAPHVHVREVGPLLTNCSVHMEATPPTTYSRGSGHQSYVDSEIYAKPCKKPNDKCVQADIDSDIYDESCAELQCSVESSSDEYTNAIYAVPFAGHNKGVQVRTVMRPRPLYTRPLHEDIVYRPRFQQKKRKVTKRYPQAQRSSSSGIDVKCPSSTESVGRNSVGALKRNITKPRFRIQSESDSDCLSSDPEICNKRTMATMSELAEVTMAPAETDCDSEAEWEKKAMAPR